MLNILNSFLLNGDDLKLSMMMSALRISNVLSVDLIGLGFFSHSDAREAIGIYSRDSRTKSKTTGW